MSRGKHEVVHRADYRVPDYWIDRADLHFDLSEDLAVVVATLSIRRNEEILGDPVPLVLDGEELELHRVAIDGRELDPREYHVEDDKLHIAAVPARFELETIVSIRPQLNTALSGLYRSSGNFCTQCEAQGFRRITYFLDRPDVMARFRTTIVAERALCPVMLSNGNRIAAGELDGGWHWVSWEDPFPKPCYLFALVAGDLHCRSGEWVTRSGRNVRLELWVERQNLERCEFALRSLARAMQWDEEVFGLEYDLDVYMMVAVNDFNMGAMENKGLNVFNAKAVLALPETATDDDYERIESVVAHEYFHNWTGNRVTCRDWFQLTLKEGLTVLRDQLFSEDVRSSAVQRIAQVRALRTSQFPEDAGPMSHPIRPDSYISIDNFYTTTVYEKGAEVVRMYRTLLGADGFRRGMDLYFERHDGHAVTCDDFRAAMADANGVDLSQFGRWYEQRGTPLVEARGRHDPGTRTYTLALRQSLPRPEGGLPAPPLHIPVAVGLVGRDGRDLPLRLDGEQRHVTAPTTRVLELREREQRFVFTGVDEPPIPSILRGFSAPVRLRIDRPREELAFLWAHDSDPFNRWDAGQALAQELLLELARKRAAGEAPRLDPLFVEAWGRVLADPGLDGAFKSLALTLPSERVLGQEMDVIDPEALHAVRRFALAELARAHRAALLATYEATRSTGPYRADARSIERRRLKHAVLAVLSSTGEPDALALLTGELARSDNMSETQAALGLLVQHPVPERDAALESFYRRWHSDPLVLDKWFALQAGSSAPDTVERVVALARHPAFTLRNPNRARALVGEFAAANQLRFHAADGRGYAFVADQVLALDPQNPQVAARFAAAFNSWRRFDAGRQARMREQLERVARARGLSKDVHEIVSRALADGPG
jgi:aminopeptidase N